MTTYNQLLAKLDRIEEIASAALRSFPSQNLRNALIRIDEVIQSKDEPSFESSKHTPVAVEWSPDWKHASNEWADVACSALVWLRNIQEGISSTVDAIANTEKCIAHCREVVAKVQAAPQGQQSACTGHDSDCAVHNMPAYPADPCDCSKSQGQQSVASGCGHIEGMGEPEPSEKDYCASPATGECACRKFMADPNGCENGINKASPTAAPSEYSFKAGELSIDTYRSSGSGGFIHKADDCVRITHLPTGIIAEAKGERSIHAARVEALRLLKVKMKERTKMPNYLPDRDPERPAESQGMFYKFEVRRVDGSDKPGGKHYGCQNFVLDMDHDPAAPAAMKAYVNAVRPTHPYLADELNERFNLDATVQQERKSTTQMANAAVAVWKDYYKIPQGVSWEPPSAALFMKIYDAMKLHDAS